MRIELTLKELRLLRRALTAQVAAKDDELQRMLRATSDEPFFPNVLRKEINAMRSVDDKLGDASTKLRLKKERA